MSENRKKQSPLTREDFQTGVKSIQDGFRTEIQGVRDELTDKLSKETRAIHQELADSTKKLHMEVIGTQNDLLKFKDEIVHQLIKTQVEMDEVKKSMMTKEGGYRIVERILNTEQALQQSIQQLKEDITRLTHLESTAQK